MKKFLPITLITALLLMTGLANQAYAFAELTFALTSNTTAEPGGTVTVPINVTNNPGFIAAGLVITFDPNVLQLTNVTAPVAEMPLNAQFTLTSTQGTQWIPFVNPNLRDWYGNGTVANIIFNVNANATPGASAITLAFISSPDGTPVTSNGDTLRNATVVSGSINITEPFADTRDTNEGTGERTEETVNDTDNDPPYTDSYSDTTDYPDYNETSNEPQDSADIIEYITVAGAQIIAGNPIYTPMYTPAYAPTYTPAYTPQPAVVETFIGTPYTQDDIGSGPAVAEFGRVPQTGVPDIMRTALAVGILFPIAAIMWLGIYRYTYKRQQRNE